VLAVDVGIAGSPPRRALGFAAIGLP
jgi:hypothetical protein